MCRVASFIADLRQRGSAKPLGYGVIGSTSDSGSFSLGSSPSTPADWFSRVFDEPTSGPHRLAAQDTALSRRRHGFKSRWGYKSDSLSCHRSRLFGSWQDFCSEGARVRIIQVSDCFLPRMGGIETQVSRLSQELADRGHDVTVLTATFDSPLRGFEKPWESSDERNAWVQGAECTATGATTAKTASPGEEGASYRVVRSGWLNPFGLPVDPRAAKRFAEYIRAQQPDVVNFHMGELTPVVMDTIRELRGEKIPTIVTIHSVWSNGPTVFGYQAGARLLGLAEEPILWAPVSELVATNVREVVGSDQIRIMGNGLIDRVEASLDKEGIEYVELGGVLPNPRSGLVYEGIELCKKEGVDFILAVGGGRTIDSSKAIAAGVKYDGDFWDFYEKGIPVEDALKVGTILTIAAAGSEGSADTVVTKEEGMLKRGASGEALRPAFSILNPELTQTLPPYQTACGITDIMAHVFERYFTNTTDVEVTDRLCEAILLTMIKEAPKVIANPDDYEARANIMWAGMVAHNNIVGVGREQDWASHGMEHELSALYDVPHGAGLAVMFPAWMKYVMKYDITRFAQVAVRVWNVEMDFANPEKTAVEGIKRFEQFLTSIGMPINFEQLGAKEEDIPYMVKTIGLGDEGTMGNFVKLTKEDVEKIYHLAI